MRIVDKGDSKYTNVRRRKRMRKLKKFVTLMFAVALLLGAIPIESILPVTANEDVGTDEVAEEINLEGEFSPEYEIEEIESNVIGEDIDLEADGNDTEVDIANEDNGIATSSVDDVGEAFIETMSLEVAPRSVIRPVIDTPFDEYTLSPGVEKDWEVSVRVPLVNPTMDIMYVVDTTGSMWGILDDVANALSQFTEDLVDAGAADIHFGTAFFGDWDYDRYDPNGWFGITLPLGGHDVPIVQGAIRDLPQTGGGADAPEDPLWAHMRVIDETNWREDSQRVIILITDSPTKLRPTVMVGGHPVTYEGAAALTIENNIDAVLMTFAPWPALTPFAELLDVDEHLWSTQAELETALRDAVIPPGAALREFEVEARLESITYESDGAPSTDVSITIDPDSFIILGGEVREFDFTAIPVVVPDRFNDTTIVEIGFYIDEERIDSATQYLRFRVDADLEFTELGVNKVWVDNDDLHGMRPERIEVQLQANGEPVEDEPVITLDEENDWESEFTELPKYDEDGEEIEYTAIEVLVPVGYTESYRTVDGVTTITNTLIVTELTVNKVWVDNDDLHGMRPESIEVQLQANGEDVEDEPVLTLDEENDWESEFTELPRYDEDGEEIEYTAIEVLVPVGYTESYRTVDGVTTITNTLIKPECPPCPPDEQCPPVCPSCPPGQPSPPGQPGTPSQPSPPNLPQTGAIVGLSVLSGSALLASGLTIASKKKLKKNKIIRK